MLLLVLVVAVLYQLLRFVLIVSSLAGSRLTEESSTVVPPEKLPADVRARIAEESREVRLLGFAPVCVIESNEMDAREDKSTHLAFFFNETTATYAIVHLMTVSPARRSALIYFVSYAPGEGATSYQTLPFAFDGLDGLRINPNLVVERVSKHPEVPNMYREHVAWLSEENFRADARLSPEELARRHELENRTILEGLVQSGRVKRAADGCYRYRPWPLAGKALKLMLATRTQLNYLNQPLPPGDHPANASESPDAGGSTSSAAAASAEAAFPSGEARAGPDFAHVPPSASEVLESEMETFRRRRASVESGKGSARWKLFWFVVTVGAFLGLGAYFWSLQLAVLLAAVVLFHELGHLAAMKAVGYRDLRVLFIPMAGAVAMGREDRSVPLWKQLVVLYAGPLPGVVVAFALMAWQGVSGYESEWLSQLIFVLLIINLFNLLPIYPLDGGQIVSVAFLGRFPFLRMFFVVASVGLLALAWLVTQILVFGILAAVIALSLFAQYQTAQMITRIRSRLPRDYDRDDEPMLLREIFRELRESAMAKQKSEDRMGVARKLLIELQQKPAGAMTMFGAITAYAFPLWAPLLILIPATHFANEDYLAKRTAMIAEGWPAGLDDLAVEIPVAENALPHLRSANELVEADPETAALVREIEQTIHSFVYGRHALTERQLEALKERLAIPEIQRVVAEIDAAASKPFLESPDWYLKDTLANHVIDVPFDPGTAATLLAARVLTADESERWLRYAGFLDFAALFRHHAVPGIRNNSYQILDVASILPAELYRGGVLPAEDEAAAISARLRRLAYGSGTDRERRIEANFVFSAMIYDPLAHLDEEDYAEYRKHVQGSLYYRISRVIGILDLSAFEKADALEGLEILKSDSVPHRLPDRYAYAGYGWGWLFEIGRPITVESLLSWADLIDFDVAPLAALFEAADFIYRWKDRHGEYPHDADMLWRTMDGNVPADPFTGDRLVYNRMEEGFELYSRGYVFGDAKEYDGWGYDPSLNHIYWEGPGAVFPEWDHPY